MHPCRVCGVRTAPGGRAAQLQPGGAEAGASRGAPCCRRRSLGTSVLRQLARAPLVPGAVPPHGDGRRRGQPRSATCGPTRSSSAATSRTRRTPSPRRRPRTRRVVAGTSASSRGAANIDGSPLFHVISGNLGYQVEHHLYPDMPSTRYGEIAPKVREICERYGLPYNSGPFRHQLGMVQRTILRLAFPGGPDTQKPGPYSGPLVRGRASRDSEPTCARWRAQRRRAGRPAARRPAIIRPACHRARRDPHRDRHPVRRRAARRRGRVRRAHAPPRGPRLRRLVVCGTTGEAATLDDEEHLRLIELAVERAARPLHGRSPASGSNDTRHAVQLTERGDRARRRRAALRQPVLQPAEPARARAPLRGGRAGHRPADPALQHPAAHRRRTCPTTCSPSSRRSSTSSGVKQANAGEPGHDRRAASSTPATTTLLADVLELGGAGGILVASHIVRRRDAPDGRRARAPRARSTHQLQDVYRDLAIAPTDLHVKAALNLLGLAVGGRACPSRARRGRDRDDPRAARAPRPAAAVRTA